MLTNQNTSIAKEATQSFGQQQMQVVSRALRNRTISRNLLKSMLCEEIRDSLYKHHSLPTINQLADNFYISPRTLSRRLSSTGINYRDLVAEMKRESAEHMLANTEMLISTIAKELGYTDKSNFSKAFKSWTGLTPKEFRQAVQEAKSVETPAQI